MFWKDFLLKYRSHGAHFHGDEVDPPELILEVRPTPESQDWLWDYRPPEIEHTDDLKNQMCREMEKRLKQPK